MARVLPGGGTPPFRNLLGLRVESGRGPPALSPRRLQAVRVYEGGRPHFATGFMLKLRAGTPVTQHRAARKRLRPLLRPLGSALLSGDAAKGRRSRSAVGHRREDGLGSRHACTDRLQLSPGRPLAALPGHEHRRRVTCGIASLTIADFGNLTVTSGIRLHGFAAFTVGTNGVTANLRIRQTDASGTIVKATGAVIAVATNLLAMNVLGADAAPGIGTYVLTLTVGSGSAASTVSAVHLSATVI